MNLLPAFVSFLPKNLVSNLPTKEHKEYDVFLEQNKDKRTKPCIFFSLSTLVQQARITPNLTQGEICCSKFLSSCSLFSHRYKSGLKYFFFQMMRFAKAGHSDFLSASMLFACWRPEISIDCL